MCQQSHSRQSRSTHAPAPMGPHMVLRLVIKIHRLTPETQALVFVSEQKSQVYSVRRLLLCVCMPLAFWPVPVTACAFCCVLCAPENRGEGELDSIPCQNSTTWQPQQMSWCLVVLAINEQPRHPRFRIFNCKSRCRRRCSLPTSWLPMWNIVKARCSKHVPREQGIGT